jgi:hypothetical protein
MTLHEPRKPSQWLEPEAHDDPQLFKLMCMKEAAGMVIALHGGAVAPGSKEALAAMGAYTVGIQNRLAELGIDPNVGPSDYVHDKL